MASLKIPRAYPGPGDLIGQCASKRKTTRLQTVRRAVSAVGEIENLENRCHLTAVTSFVLVDALTDRDIGPITSGSTINLATLPSRSINIRAEADATTESIEFFQNGTFVRTENSAPYALQSDQNGDYYNWTPGLKTYTVSATPYSKDAKGGNQGATSSITFTVIDQPVVNPVVQSVTGFTLYNADTNQPIGPIEDGATINLKALPTSRLNIRANTTSTIGGVKFGMDSVVNFYDDAKADFYLRGDNGSGDVYAWVPIPGSHTLTATPYGTNSLVAGTYTGATLNFTIIDQTAVAPTVNIVNPINNSSKVGPASFVVLAAASDPDGEVTKVEFYANNELIGVAYDAPFSMAISDVATGAYKVTAKAYDNSGNVTTSAAVNVTVNAPQVGKTYYVSPTGNDSNPGSTNAPLKTINRAAKLAVAGDTVLIRAGTYRETVWLDNSGTADRPITFKAVTAGTVFIDGSEIISGWTPAGGAIYSTTWSYDFFMNGKRTWGNTFNGTEYAEQFMVGNTPLTRVENASQMFAGAFWINYDTDKVFIWLPKSADARTTQILGSTRSTLFAPSHRDLGTAEYIRVEGLTFRRASNFAQPQQAGVKTDNGWVILDSKFQYMNGTGLGVFGNDITILRSVAENNGQSGIGGSSASNVLVKDSVTRFNNYRKVRVYWEAGGGKWSKTNNVYMDNYTAYGNLGHGIWFDTENRNTVVVNSESFDNKGINNINEASGVFFEINPGPTRIDNNYIHGNTGSAILVAETQDIVVENNILIDNYRGVELRDMPDRIYSIDNVTIRNNQIRGWVETGIGTLQGTWNSSTAENKNILIENNVYDFSGSLTNRLFRWGSVTYKTLAALEAALGFEAEGDVGSVLPPPA